MKKKLKFSLGSDDFKKLATTSNVFVDKSLFIQEILENGEEATLITRPRRWGKSIALDMLKHFFSIQHKESSKFFSKLKISNATTWSPKSDEEINILDYYQGRYPVIHVSLKDTDSNTMEEFILKFQRVIGELYKDHKYLLEGDKLDEDDKKDFKQYFKENLTEVALEPSLKDLSKFLYKYHGENVYILVDEYDKPINSLLENNTKSNHALIKQISKFISAVLSNCGKSNQYLEKIILTGIFDTLKKEGGSGFNNVVVYDILDKKYSKSFGFSENEVRTIIDKFPFKHLESIFSNITTWYNGYTTGNDQKLYTPWPVLRYMSAIQENDGYAIPESYWINSGSSAFFDMLLKNAPCNKENQFMQMLGKITKEDRVTINYDRRISLYNYDLTNPTKEESLFSYFLVNSGYLTASSVTRDNALLSIPNNEVRHELASMYKRHSKISNAQDPICKAIFSGLGIDPQEKVKTNTIFETISNHNILPDDIFVDSQLNICSIKKYDMHVAQYAALSGNRKALMQIVKKCSQHISFDEKTTALNLTLADYSFMSGDKNSMSYVKSLGVNTSLTAPTISSKFLCTGIDLYNTHMDLGTTAIGILVSGVISKAGSFVVPLIKNHPYISGGVSAFLTLMTGGFFGYKNFGQIKQFDPYQNYEEIKEIVLQNKTICKKTLFFQKMSRLEVNVDSYSLNEFYKYRLENPDSSYVSTNSTCTKGYETISNFINSENYEDLSNGIQLCGKVTIQDIPE